jgi:hypothetical protein
VETIQVKVEAWEKVAVLPLAAHLVMEACLVAILQVQGNPDTLGLEQVRISVESHLVLVMPFVVRLGSLVYLAIWPILLREQILQRPNSTRHQ